MTNVLTIAKSQGLDYFSFSVDERIQIFNALAASHTMGYLAGYWQKYEDRVPVKLDLIHVRIRPENWTSGQWSSIANACHACWNDGHLTGWRQAELLVA